MDKIVIHGGHRLTGHLPISGSKNAVLPLMILGLLTDEPLKLVGTPRLTDTRTLGRVLEEAGADIALFGRGRSEGLTVHAAEITQTTAPYELVSEMRASFWVIGPLLARCGQARVSLPGGCAIGTRPVNLYLNGLAAMGAEIEVEDGYVNARVKPASGPSGGRLTGAHIDFPFVSVGATHVMMMAASLAEGQTVIDNAACEPEIVDVGRCLRAMGARIEGLGTRRLVIDGVDRLSGTTHNVIRDRIEAGAYACAVAATRGEVTLTGADKELLGALCPALQQAGVEFTQTGEGLLVRGSSPIRPVNIVTGSYPGFATDLQAPFMGLMCLADGVSHIRETIFENRFMHVQELVRLGADIDLQGDTARVSGVPKLKGAPVMATDLRASVTLVIAGLVAEGETTIHRVYHLDRGYENLEEKLSGCGADIRRSE